MKVVLFCGGRGVRLQDFGDPVPKPLITIGARPLVWHIMKYYAHYGHHDFILCLGLKGNLIKEYFVNYKEYISNDFTLRAGSKIDLLRQDIKNWRITFVDTGSDANTAERLLAVKKYLNNEEMFLANYAEGLTDADLPTMVQRFNSSKKVAMVMVSSPKSRYHVASLNEADGMVTGIRRVGDLNGLWINTGYYIFRNEIFRHIDSTADLPEATFQNLIALNQLMGYPHRGLFAAPETFTDREELEEICAGGDPPWQPWRSEATPRAETTSR